MVPGSVPFKIMSDSHALHPRWPPLLKIEMSSNGQNCFILSQNVSKFELYKHNDELLTGTCKVRNEIETKRNENERKETNRNQTKRN
jgi:hypothetical protein